MELRPVVSPTTSSVQLSPFEIRIGNSAAAEKAASEIIRKIQPTSASELKRREVIEYIQRLTKNCVGAELFPYGSVPLKTFLPDGDIDLTAFGGSNVEDSLTDVILSLLEEEAKNDSAKFVIKDVQLIRAEVKIVKCIANNIVVDISVNQIGGLCTLCFLEQIDRLIGKDHLFKRSIILIKAWCYYESRILGAHHGLISTYALETLVLYIFNIFHSTLDGPLSVLYKFLDYFSKFDWEVYCISLNGPIRLSSLPAMEAEMPEDCDGPLLMSHEFISSCIDMFSVPSRCGELISRGFQRKHLNIVDPLKEKNNLGRSVSKGNFYRVRSAFSYGARKLAKILAWPENCIGNELHKFFSNTISRHGGGQRPDLRDFDPSLSFNRSISTVLIPEPDLFDNDGLMNECYDTHKVATGDFWSRSGSTSLAIELEEKSNMAKGEQEGSLVSTHPSMLLNKGLSPNSIGLGFPGYDNDLATFGMGNLKISNDYFHAQSPIGKESVSSVGRLYHLPHHLFVNSKLHISNKLGNLDENQLVQNDEEPSPSRSKHINHEQESSSMDNKLKSLENFSNLAGDFDSYLQCLQYGRWCYEHVLDIHSLHAPTSSTTSYQNHYPTSQFMRNGHVNGYHNRFLPSPAIYAMQPVFIPGVTVGLDGIRKPRGTGTYFPNMNQPPSGYRPSAIEGRNQALLISSLSHGGETFFKEANAVDRSGHESSQPQGMVDKILMDGSADGHQPCSLHGGGYPNFNVLVTQSNDIEYGALVMEKSRQRVSSSPRNSPGTPRSPPAFSKNKDRISLRYSYQLKDEDDFPRLSV